MYPQPGMCNIELRETKSRNEVTRTYSSRHRFSDKNSQLLSVYFEICTNKVCFSYKQKIAELFERASCLSQVDVDGSVSVAIFMCTCVLIVWGKHCARTSYKLWNCWRRFGRRRRTNWSCNFEIIIFNQPKGLQKIKQMSQCFGEKFFHIYKT